MFSSQEVRTAHHLANGGNQTGPASGDAKRLFLAFGRAGI